MCADAFKGPLLSEISLIATLMTLTLQYLRVSYIPLFKTFIERINSPTNHNTTEWQYTNTL